MTLMYSTVKDKPMTRPELALLETPAPMGNHHRPMPFGEYADIVVKGLVDRGLEVVKEEYAVTRNEQQMFGVIEVADRNLSLAPAKRDNDWGLMIGLRGSHNQTLARGLTMGSHVYVCSNLGFHGELLTMKTMQTTNIMTRIIGLVGEALDKIPGMAADQEARFDAYKNTVIRPEHGDQMLVEIHRRGGFSGSQLATAIAEWDKPSFASHAEYNGAGQRSVWQLYNACTQALKPTGNHVNMDIVRARSQVADELINRRVGLAKAA